MKKLSKFGYIAVLALCGSGLAQDQNQSPRQSQPTRPDAARQPAATTSTSESTATRANQGLKNMFRNWRVEELPAPVQKTVREQAGGQQVADIDREDRTGQTVWEVEFEREGRNPKIHVANDGRLLSEQEASALHKDDGLAATPGVGAPAGAQTGRTRTGLGTQWEDLPQPVQQKAMQFGGKDKAKDIDLKHRNGRNLYAVEFDRPGRNLEVLFSEDGTVVKSNDANAAPAYGGQSGIEAGRSPSTLPAQPAPPIQPNQNPSSDQIK
jgi:uncharacterized membrane protein YkoI